MADDRTIKQRTMQRWGALKQERSSWMAHWQEISTYLLPRSGRFLEAGEQNNGQRKHNNIFDNTGTRALKIMAAGLMSGATSPARPWFRLQTADKELNQLQSVRIWLDDVTQRVLDVFAKSNTYRVLHQNYLELGAFGTAGSVVLPNYDTVIHQYPLTVGEFAIGCDAEGKVDTLYRVFEMTVSQVVDSFGEKNCSVAVQNLWKDGKALDKYVKVLHAIEPRAYRDVTKKDDKNMPFYSCYYEIGAQDDDKVLRESGFKQFRALMPRWEVTGGDIYGNSPGMEALGDIKQLQHEQLRKANAIDYQTNPPLSVPSGVKDNDVNKLPGGVTWRPPGAPNDAIKNLFEVSLDLNHLLADIQDVRGRINASFFADLFMMIADAEVGKMTATEVAARQEEKMLMLGPVLERLNNELLYPLVDITFNELLEGGGIPPAPDEMQGMNLNVEFVGILAQAQRAIGVNSIDRFLGTVGAMAQFNPEVVDKVDANKIVDVYGDKIGVPPEIIRSDEKVAAIQDARNKANAAKEQAAVMEQQSKVAKNLASSPTGGQPNALQDMMNQYSGYGSPSPTEVQ